MYSKTNQMLAEEIVEKDICLVNGYLEGISPRKENSATRARLQALLCLPCKIK